MFEYTALVDAPVRQFTGIVTGPDPDAAPPAARVTLAARSAGAIANQVIATPGVAPGVATQGVAPAHPVTSAAPAHRPRQTSLTPALVAVAGTAIAATLVLRWRVRGHLQ